jgi:hypothetical protein
VGGEAPAIKQGNGHESHGGEPRDYHLPAAWIVSAMFDLFNDATLCRRDVEAPLDWGGLARAATLPVAQTRDAHCHCARERLTVPLGMGIAVLALVCQADFPMQLLVGAWTIRTSDQRTSNP